MPSFEDTIDAINDGVRNGSTAGAISNIEAWQETISALDAPGAQAISQNLESLKAELQAGTPDGEAIRSLMARLGQQTTALAGSAGENADEIEELGQTLTDAAQHA